MEKLVLLTFILGYVAIAFEHTININKAATALVAGVLCWTFYILFTSNKHVVGDQLTDHLGELSGILFFLLGTIFLAGVLILILVPIFKSVTQLPPYMGILIGLGFLWIITELMHGGKPDIEKNKLSVSHALRKIDTPSILFFLGILLSISALQSVGILASLAKWTSGHVADENIIAISTGLLSAIVDNVPLVAATQGMFDLKTYPTDHSFWQFLAYTTAPVVVL